MSLPRKPFGSVCHLVNGKAFKPTDWSAAGAPIIRIQNLNNADKPFNYWAGPLDKQVRISTGDLLLAWSGTPGTSFGAHIWDGPSGILNQHIFRCDLDEKAITKEWARIAVNHRLHRLIEQAHGGVGLQHVTRGMVEELEIPLPPLAEQRQIAKVLDRAEALRAKRRAALAHLDTLTHSIFLEMFGHPATNPKKWPRSTLGEVASQKPNNGIFKKNHEYSGETTNTLPVVWVEELFQGDSLNTGSSRRLGAKASEVRKYGLHNGDILFCRSSLKLDGIAYNNVYEGDDEGALFECHIIRLRPNQGVIDPVFLNVLMRTPAMRRIAKSKAKTATMTTIDQQNLRAIQIPLPPLKLQQEFVARFDEIRRLRRRMEKSLSEMKDLSACLQWHAFRGQLGKPPA